MREKTGVFGERKKFNREYILFNILFALIVLVCASFFSLAEEAQTGTAPATGSPLLSITATPETGNTPLTVSFSATPAAENYSWDLNGDGTPESTEVAPSFTYEQAGTYTVTLTATGKDASGTEITRTATKQITVVSPIALSITATPTSGQAPLTVQFTLAAAGKSPLSYSWDFNWDKKPDSTLQNPTFTYTAAGDYKTTVTVTDAEGNTVIATAPISVITYDSHLNLSSYFPDTFNPGENSVTIIVVNQGTEPVKDITAKIVGKNIQHLASSSISLLNPGDQDSLTVKVNFLQTGDLTATAKVLDKVFPLSFTVKKGETYNKEELQTRFEELKKQLQEQESIYYDKKSQSYLVSEVFENIKNIQKQLQEVQQQLLTNKLPEAKVGLELTGGAITDLSADLQQARKQKITLLMWMKENAVAITAIIATLGTLSGILVKAKQHAVKVKDQAQKLVQEGAQKISDKIEEGKKKKKKRENEGKKEEEKEGEKENNSEEKMEEQEEKKNQEKT